MPLRVFVLLPCFLRQKVVYVLWDSIYRDRLVERKILVPSRLVYLYFYLEGVCLVHP